MLPSCNVMASDLSEELLCLLIVMYLLRIEIVCVVFTWTACGWKVGLL